MGKFIAVCICIFMIGTLWLIGLIVVDVFGSCRPEATPLVLMLVMVGVGSAVGAAAIVVELWGGG